MFPSDTDIQTKLKLYPFSIISQTLKSPLKPDTRHWTLCNVSGPHQTHRHRPYNSHWKLQNHEWSSCDPHVIPIDPSLLIDSDVLLGSIPHLLHIIFKILQLTYLIEVFGYHLVSVTSISEYQRPGWWGKVWPGSSVQAPGLTQITSCQHWDGAANTILNIIIKIFSVNYVNWMLVFQSLN